jgi:hypothetical protein
VPERLLHLQTLIKGYLSEGSKIMEVGTWFGEGSTKVIVENAPKDSTIYMVDSWSPYASKEDIDSELKPYFSFYRTMDDLTFSAFHNVARIIETYKRQRPDLTFILIKGKSSDLINILKDNSFDLIYIDANHSYEGVTKDIMFAKKLVVKDLGVICGDDLEILPNDNDLWLARQSLKRDYIRSTSLEYFHPGVMLAVSENFSQVKMSAGFWWIFSNNYQSLPKS